MDKIFRDFVVYIKIINEDIEDNGVVIKIISLTSC